MVKKFKIFPIGTSVRVIKVHDEFADKRNLNRCGIIVENDQLVELDSESDILYIIEFTDGIIRRPQHWVDLEAGLPDNQSAHYHSELENL